MIQHDSQEIIIREATAREVASWDELVARFDGQRIFHKMCWLRYLESVSGARPLFLIYEKGGEVVGCLPGLLLKKAMLRIFGSPLVGWQTESMGPIFDASRISASEISRALVPFLQERFGVQHIEMTSAQLSHPSMSELRFRGRQVSTYRLPLYPGDEERVLKNMKATRRNRLRKAIKLGLLVRFETEESFVDELYDQTREVFARRAKTVPFGRESMLECFRHLRDGGHLLAISVLMPGDGTCIATGLFMIEGRELHLWGWAHRTSYRQQCPSELLTWAAMQKAMEAGCVTMDMAGGGDFKQKFGAVRDVSLTHWMWSRYEWLARLRHSAEKAYRWQQSVRGQLANKIGGRKRESAAQVGAHALRSLATPEIDEKSSRGASAERRENSAEGEL